MAVPKLGRSTFEHAANAKLSSAAEELLHLPQPKELGTVPLSKFIADVDGPPPWELSMSTKLAAGDAQRFVEFPQEWEVRWLSPRLVNQVGLRYWKAVPADHERVKVLVPSIVAPDNTIRKADHNGDFLAYMPKAWVESRIREKEKEVQRRTALATERAAQTVEQVNRGAYGKYTKVTSFKHPTHTNADGRTFEP